VFHLDATERRPGELPSQCASRTIICRAERCTTFQVTVMSQYAAGPGARLPTPGSFRRDRGGDQHRRVADGPETLTFACPRRRRAGQCASATACLPGPRVTRWPRRQTRLGVVKDNGVRPGQTNTFNVVVRPRPEMRRSPSRRQFALQWAPFPGPPTGCNTRRIWRTRVVDFIAGRDRHGGRQR
jgi:hypothetical protein